MAQTLPGPRPEFLQHEVLSKSTQPLLNYIFRLSPHLAEEKKPKSLGKLFREVASKSDRVIPDESEQLEQVLINLIDNGPGTPVQGKSVTIVGAGVSGLCAGYELKKAGFDIQILEASSRVGGRVKTFRDPTFAPGLHGEGGAMRIPADHFLLRKYIEDFGMNNDLFDFEMENKFIYLSGYDGGRTFTYDEFDNMLVAMDKTLMKLFPGLKDNEKGKTCDDLFATAVQPVVDAFWKAYDALQTDEKETSYPDPGKIKRAYGAITKLYDQYSLRSYLIEVAGWSQDALNLYDLGNAHVVFENGFIESWKDAFLSSNSGGGKAGMQQLQGGMDTVPKAFVDPARGKDSLIDNITFGARVTHIGFASEPGIGQSRVAITYQNNSQKNITVESDYLILAIPYTSQRTISKSVAFAPYQEMAIREVRYVEVTKILLQYKTRWWETIFTKNNQGLDGGMVCDLPIRYTMFPKTAGNRQAIDSNRGVVMAAYTFEQDATILGSQSPSGRIEMAAANLDTVFPTALSLNELEVGVSQVFPADEMSGGSAFCYFGPTQKSVFLDIMCQSDWNERAFFAGEQASYTHGWIQGAFEAGLRCVQQVYAAATEAVS